MNRFLLRVAIYAARGPRLQPVGARSRATGVARLRKMNTGLPVIPKSDYRTPKDGFETYDAGRAGARPYRLAA